MQVGYQVQAALIRFIFLNPYRGGKKGRHFLKIIHWEDKVVLRKIDINQCGIFDSKLVFISQIG